MVILLFNEFGAHMRLTARVSPIIPHFYNFVKIYLEIFYNKTAFTQNKSVKVGELCLIKDVLRF